MFERFQGPLILKSPALQALFAFAIVFLGSQFFAPQFNDKYVLLRSVFLQIGLVFGIPFTMGRCLKVGIRADLKLKPTSLRNLAFSVLIALSLLGLLEEMVYLQFRIFGVIFGQETSITDLLKVNSLSDPGWILFTIGLVPAFCEEFLFRGFIFKRLLQPNQTGQAVMLSSVLFGVFHRSITALFNNTVAGIVLSLIVFRSGSLFNSILAHAVINTVTIGIANSKGVSSIFSTSQKGLLPSALLAASLAGLLFGIKGLRSEGKLDSASKQF